MVQPSGHDLPRRVARPERAQLRAFRREARAAYRTTGREARAACRTTGREARAAYRRTESGPSSRTGRPGGPAPREDGCARRSTRRTHRSRGRSARAAQFPVLGGTARYRHRFAQAMRTFFQSAFNRTLLLLLVAHVLALVWLGPDIRQAVATRAEHSSAWAV